MRVYVDTSAAAKLMLLEAESVALQSFANRNDVELVSSTLLETELRRIAIRNQIPQAMVTRILDGISMFDLAGSDFKSAGLLPGETLRSLDALHLQGAVVAEVDCVLTYDTRMSELAEASVGIPVIQPH